ncbi:M20/M25/M40 family metallo-hydrolase [Vulgatibacter incomptus]|uniref:Putative peptidase n=1 Tax=Vulgatibacter incomptus TaxID=1391653 RepID=A0A0K1PG37_9BACT|nr:M20/M25/M40 family metallo-hydrolase [Vulgatibacter incomptus]AKU92498.1 putative peptidase [Vulgatibacter incomptus]
MHETTYGDLAEEWVDEALRLLVTLLRIDTTNPPGNERPAAEACAELLRKDGLEPVLLEGARDRTNLVCRWKGSGEAPPLLLTAHLDVVPAGEGWTHPPFAGEIRDGFVWGRGAIDMKHHAAMCVTLLRSLARTGAKLKRDVILALVADEEAGCDLGSAWLVDHHPELVRSEYALGEIGGFTLHLEGRRFYPIQVAQKGVLWIKATARGEGGHGSMPREKSAVGKLSAAIARLERRPLRIHATDATRGFLETAAQAVGPPKGLALRALLNPRLAPWILRALPDRALARSLRAVLSNTVAPTMLRAGDKLNVIPDRAEAGLDGRTLPGAAGARLLDELRAVVGEDVELEVVRVLDALEVSPRTPLFEALAAAIRRADPAGIPVPYMVPGFTDALAFSRLGTKWYGFAPVGLPPGLPFAELFHDKNERIPVDGFGFGMRLLHDAVTRFCTA